MHDTQLQDKSWCRLVREETSVLQVRGRDRQMGKTCLGADLCWCCASCKRTERERAREREREIKRVYHTLWVCQSMRENESEGESMCVCGWVYVCTCMYKRETLREGVRVCVYLCMCVGFCRRQGA